MKTSLISCKNKGESLPEVVVLGKRPGHSESQEKEMRTLGNRGEIKQIWLPVKRTLYPGFIPESVHVIGDSASVVARASRLIITSKRSSKKWRCRGWWVL